jgi:transaldolase/glucose-6-phosphate isomerase
MSEACGPGVPESDNPGVILAAALGELTLAKRDKVTFVCSPSLAAFPTWAEQLIAESTGKDRKGIVPVANERLSAPAKYSNDRLFVYLRFAGDENHDLDREIAALEANGHPALRIDVNDKHDLGQEFFRWEFAVAGAGAALGIHPFNQPDVQLAKDLAKKAMENGARGGARIKNEIAANDLNALQGALSAWLAKKKSRDYVAVQAFFQPSPDNTQELERLRAELQARLVAATSLGFGPRYLHSTGQLHKGGPNTVLVLQIVDQSTSNLAVPETNYTFDALIQAQSLGDYAALKQRRRRMLRVNLGRDTVTGLRAVIAALQA